MHYQTQNGNAHHAEGSVTAVSVDSAKAGVLQVSWSTWPNTMDMTTSMRI